VPVPCPGRIVGVDVIVDADDPSDREVVLS